MMHLRHASYWVRANMKSFHEERFTWRAKRNWQALHPVNLMCAQKSFTTNTYRTCVLSYVSLRKLENTEQTEGKHCRFAEFIFFLSHPVRSSKADVIALGEHLEAKVGSIRPRQSTGQRPTSSPRPVPPWTSEPVTSGAATTGRQRKTETWSIYQFITDTSCVMVQGRPTDVVNIHQVVLFLALPRFLSVPIACKGWAVSSSLAALCW